MWTKEIEEQLQSLGNCARGYIWMYDRDKSVLEKKFDRLKKVSVFISTLSGALGTLSLAIGVDQSTVIIFFSVILSFISSMSQGYLNTAEYGALISDLNRNIRKYSSFANNVRRQLSRPRKSRERADDYYRWISENYNQINEDPLAISEETVKEYNKKAPLLGLPTTDQIGIDSKIAIHGGSKPPSRMIDPEEVEEPRERAKSEGFLNVKEPEPKREEVRMEDRNLDDGVMKIEIQRTREDY
jgi:hypothetical protein